jgi:L-malate glycosyltransferase
MTVPSPLRIGITCYPSVGGSGVLASSLGEELARRGHEVHFVSHERPFRLPPDTPNTYFHAVPLLQQGPFRYPDYTLPLAVHLAEVARERQLDIIHAHYAVPHATAAVLAAQMLPAEQRPRVITTLHGTDTTLLAHEPGYGAVIRHALLASDGVTAVSEFLRRETQRILEVSRPIEMIHNFFDPRPLTRSREEVRRELGIRQEKLVVHVSNLRPVKRIHLLLETFARLEPAADYRLLILAGADFAPYRALVRELGLTGRVLIRENVVSVENYLQAADVGLFTSASESFCLSILEAMAVGCPSVACSVGGIPEVVEHDVSGILVPQADPAALAAEVHSLLQDPARREAMAQAGITRAREHFSAEQIVPRYEAYYHRVAQGPK